jgi:hypothetical protein
MPPKKKPADKKKPAAAGGASDYSDIATLPHLKTFTVSSLTCFYQAKYKQELEVSL